MKAISNLICWLGAAAVATAQTNGPKNADAPAAEPTNAPAVSATPTSETAGRPDSGGFPDDLEQHPYRRFGDKQCYLTPLLRWEQLDADHRQRTRNPMPVWRPLHGTVLQLTSTGSLIEATNTAQAWIGGTPPSRPGHLLQDSNTVLFVKNLPEQKSLTNGQAVAFHAIRIPGQTYTYTNAAGAERKADAYDYGVPFQPKFVPLLARTNLTALYHAQAIKAIQDQITALENTDSQLRDQELYLKRVRGEYRQPRRNVMREQYALTQISAQRTAIRQQIAALNQQKAKLEGAPASPTNTLPVGETNQATATVGAPTNAPSRTNPSPNRYRTPPPPAGSP